MKVIIREAAFADLDRIYAVIANDRPNAAGEVVNRIIDAFERLAMFPRMGRRGAVSGTREWVVRGLPYIVVYQAEIQLDALIVVAVFHAARKRSSKRSRKPVAPTTG